ncbi:hypothetical protein HOF78_03060 [Candidatus Woesearchaeota archaeon]|jgi:hypothetical protein|nr:hypothetical protein [Candidatus Woesearchaeota archaeon]MBT6044829.1 hypothetical protein [Candidatus Woesearchaeota archaeon]
MAKDKAKITSKNILDTRRDVLPAKKRLDGLVLQLVNQRSLAREIAHAEVLIALAEKRFEDALPMIVLYNMSIPPGDLKKVADAYCRDGFNNDSEYLTFVRNAYRSLGMENEARELHGSIVDAVEQENYEKEASVEPAQ